MHIHLYMSKFFRNFAAAIFMRTYAHTLHMYVRDKMQDKE